MATSGAMSGLVRSAQQMPRPLAAHRVGDDIELEGRPWSFAEPVPGGFDAHVARSVPLYAEGHRLVAAISDFFVRPASTTYDVGCSTGALLEALAARHAGLGARFVGLDSELAMVHAAQRRLRGTAAVELVHADARSYPWQPADLVIAYYVLQFLPPVARAAVVAAWHAALNPGGALVIFEKVLAPTPRLQEIAGQLYTDAKLDAGYRPDELQAKARSLRGVLVPMTSTENRRLLHRAGFAEVMTVQHSLGFEGLLALKATT